ncbi:MAG: IS110 family transposase [Actinomycetota bacterium]|nr:IS110 family transposase [Actinomycetota bacterium]
MLFLGDDWSEERHDLALIDEDGRVLVERRVTEDVDGVAAVHEMVAEAGAPDPGGVVVGIETDRGLLVRALVSSGYQVFAVNPRSVDRYRDRHRVSGAKSDRSDARVLANLVRTDRAAHRPVRGDSDVVEAVRLLARCHQGLIWARQRHLNQVRTALREFYPGALAAFGTDLAHPDAVAVLSAAPTPSAARKLTDARIARLLRAAGRQRRINRRATEIGQAMRVEALATPPVVTDAYGATVAAGLGVISELTRRIVALEEQLADRFEQHPDAELLHRLPGLGVVLGARVLAEFGDDPERYPTVRNRKNYAGAAPITRQSGRRASVHARFVRNRRLADALHQWAFCSLTTSPGARAYYDTLRSRGIGHSAALRQLANRWVGILHGVLRHRVAYNEYTAWGHHLPDSYKDQRENERSVLAA